MYLREKLTDDQEFIEAWKRLGSITLVSEELKITARREQERRKNIEAKYGIPLNTFNDNDLTKSFIQKTRSGPLQTSLVRSLFFPTRTSCHKKQAWLFMLCLSLSRN